LLVHAAEQLQRRDSSASPASRELACAALLRGLQSQAPRVSHAVTCSAIKLLVRATHRRLVITPLLVVLEVTLYRP
jgi:hypothetical protein